MSMLGFVLALVALQQPPPAPSVAAPLPPLPPQVGDTWPFRRLTLPTPNEMREGAGTPGPRYWQQRADYTIRATLDTATHTIAGSETLRYANNSPDTLHYLWLHEVAQWYPRVAVYDDVRGWNTEQYLGQGEFYLEYGDFDVSITVPRSFVVAATGTLTNAVEVLTAGQRARLSRAVRSDTTVAIITKAEAGQPSSRPAGPRPTLTWHFTAKHVRR